MGIRGDWHLGRGLLGEGRTGFVYWDQSATLGKDLTTPVEACPEKWVPLT